MTWSLTKLKTFEQCGAKYDFRYNQKIPDKSGPAAERGTAIHKTIEGFIRGVEGIALTGSLEFYHGFLTALKESQVPLYPEYRIALRQDWTPCPDGESPWYVGYLDLYRAVEISANAWDWKSGKPYPDHDQDKEVYALAIMAAKPEIQVVTVTYTYVDKGQNRERIFSREFEYEALKKKWGDRVARMEAATQFIPNPQFLCRYCSYSKVNGGPCRF